MFNRQLTEKNLTGLHCRDNPNTVQQTDLNDCKATEEKGAFLPNSVGSSEEKENGMDACVFSLCFELAFICIM